MTPVKGFPVSIACAAGADELALEVRKTDDSAGAVITSFDVHYVSNGEPRTINYPARIVLCSPQGVPAEDCAGSS
jgi:hypothetical protein